MAGDILVVMTENIAHLRLINQSIAAPQLSDPVDVVRSLGAVQAQDYGQSLWAIGLRMKNAALVDVLGAIESGKILRTWPMRGTIHFVPAEDAKWMVGLTGERTLRAARARHDGLDLSDKVFVRAEALLRRELEGGKRLARPALMKLLDDNGIATQNQRGYHILWTLALRGVLCIGPMEGKQQTYALLDEWAPHAVQLRRDEALGELAKRYFSGHGPATLADFATWAGQPQRDATIGLEIAKSGLTSIKMNDKEYWLGRNTREVSKQSLEATYLLAGFEEYVLGYKDRSDIIAPQDAAQFYINGIFFPIIVRDGRAIGVWRRTISAKNIKVRIAPFESWPPNVMAEAHAKAARYGEFMGLPIVFE